MSLWMLLLWMISPIWQAQTTLASPAVPEWTEYRLFAHGMGAIDGKTLTNSYEAFEHNYRKGIRVFETDLRLTSDGQSVALHDWPAFLFSQRQDVPDPSDRQPVDWQTFKELKVDDMYQTVDIYDIVGLLEQYPDAWIVTDTKDVSERLVKLHFGRIAEAIEQSPLPGIGDRIIPQLYKPEMYEWVESQYPFSGYIYTLYLTNASDKEVLQFVKEKPKIKAVAMPKERISPALVSALRDLGVKVYTHTVNDLSTFKSVRQKGLDGVYTDFLEPDSLADR